LSVIDNIAARLAYQLPSGSKALATLPEEAQKSSILLRAGIEINLPAVKKEIPWLSLLSSRKDNGDMVAFRQVLVSGAIGEVWICCELKNQRNDVSCEVVTGEMLACSRVSGFPFSRPKITI